MSISAEDYGDSKDIQDEFSDRIAREIAKLGGGGGGDNSDDNGDR